MAMAPAQQRIEPSFRPVRWALARAGRGSHFLPQAPLPKPRPRMVCLSVSVLVPHGAPPGVDASSATRRHGRKYDLELAGTRARTDVSSESEYGRILKADSAIPRRKGCTS